MTALNLLKLVFTKSTLKIIPVTIISASLLYPTSGQAENASSNESKQEENTTRIYKTVLPDGTVVFSDLPSEDKEVPSEVIEQKAVPTVQFKDLPDFSATPDPYIRERADHQYEVNILSPTNEQTFRNIGGVIQVRVSSTPSIRAGHGFVLKHNGRKVYGPTHSRTLSALEVFRGSHVFSVDIVDKRGKTIASSPAVKVFVHQNSAN